MALVLGTNCGFVTVAPTSDPNGNANLCDDRAQALKDTSPSGTDLVVTEIGWWCDNATQEANFEVGIYDHNSGDDEPENLLSGASTINAKGTGAGWKVSTGLNIPISAETIYWMAFQLDDTSTTTNFNKASTGGDTKWQGKLSQTDLTDPWGTSAFSDNFKAAIYAKVGSASAGTNMKINIGDVFKDVDALKINIGDVWKDVVSVKQNIGDVWKDVF